MTSRTPSARAAMLQMRQSSSGRLPPTVLPSPTHLIEDEAVTEQQKLNRQREIQLEQERQKAERVLQFCRKAQGDAVFSTKRGQYRARSLPSTNLPMPIVRSNISHDVNNKAQDLEDEFPDIACTVQEPRGMKAWEELYKYFDGYDLYVEGPEFCIHVITQIAKRNAHLERNWNHEIDQYAAGWVMHYSEILIHRPEVKDLTLLFNADAGEDLNGLTAPQEELLRRKLDFYRNRLMQQHEKMIRESQRKQLQSTEHRDPVAGILPMPQPPHIARHPSVSIGGASKLNPIQAIPPGSFVSYQKFMDMQSRTQYPPLNFTSGFNRQRGLSDISRCGPREKAQCNDLGHRTVSNTPRRTSWRQQPVYVFNGPESSSPSKSFTRSSTFSNDARKMAEEDIPFRNHPKASISGNGSCTFYYVGDARSYTTDTQNIRTIFVGGVHRDMFIDHTLRNMFSDCGEVESVHYPQAHQSGSSYALITFTGESSGAVDKAITRFDRFQLPETRDHLTVRRPRARANNENRVRSNSAKSFIGTRAFHTPRTFEEYRPRRQSIREIAVSVPRHDDSPNQITVSIESQANEIMQHRAAVDRLLMPLASLENLPPKIARTKSDNADSAIEREKKKENSPIKQYSPITPLQTLKKDDGNKMIKGGKGKKTNSNNASSARRTPSSSPSKSLSQCKMTDIADSSTKLNLSETKEDVPLEMKQLSLQPKKTKKNKKNKALPSATDSAPISVTDASESFQSLAESTVSEPHRSRSANTSHTSLSSRRNESPASKFLDTNPILEHFRPINNDVSTPKRSGKSRKSGNHQNQCKKENEVPIKIQPSNDTAESASSNDKEQQPQHEKLRLENDQPRSKHAKKSTDEKNHSLNHEEKVEDNEIFQSQEAYLNEETRLQPNQSKPTEELKTLKAESGINTNSVSQRKFDNKAASVSKKSTQSSSQVNAHGLSEVTLSPLNPFEDPGEWPALKPSDLPQSAIADGKRPPPPPMRYPSGQRKAVEPAVPNILKRPRAQQ